MLGLPPTEALGCLPGCVLVLGLTLTAVYGLWSLVRLGVIALIRHLPTPPDLRDRDGL